MSVCLKTPYISKKYGSSRAKVKIRFSDTSNVVLSLNPAAQKEGGGFSRMSI